MTAKPKPLHARDDGRVLGPAARATRALLLEQIYRMLEPGQTWRRLQAIDVALEAAVSPATFYQYFSSIEAAFDHMYDERRRAGRPMTAYVHRIARLRASERLMRTAAPVNNRDKEAADADA